MREILAQLFGEAVTDDAMKLFNAELGKKFVAKADFNAKTEEIKTLKGANKTLEDEIAKLNEAANSGEDVKAELEALKAKVASEKAQAEAERILREKNASILSRFDAVVGDREFSHGAIKADYLKKFGDALEDEKYVGQSDSDIFHALTKDDATAFTGVTAVKLPGGGTNPTGGKKYTSKDEIMAIKDSTERLSAIQANSHLFRKE